MAYTHAASVTNDLKAAIEVQQGNGWKVVYPGRSLPLNTEEAVLRLREAPTIAGRCLANGSLRASESFGSEFASEARRRDQEEEEAAAHEEQRREEVRRCQDAQTRQAAAALRDKKIDILPVYRRMSVGFGIPLALLIFTAAFPPHSDLAAALLGSFALLLGCFLSTCTFLHGTGDRVDHFRYGKHSNCIVRVAFLSFALGVIALAALTMHHSLAGFWWTALIVWPLTCCVNTCWIYAAKVEAEEGCYLTAEEQEMQDKEQQQARQEVLQRTIVFEGSVLEGVGRPCVCSWPGRYEGAWDSLVSSSRNGDVSAAVVFLPDGTADFGHHAEIPETEGIVGECWCVPLYGEQKPWGCRWWSHWIANIEEAVKKEADLVVYYFVDHVGRGKAQSFATAGQEHLRRETLNRRLDEFKETQQFKEAVDAGLAGLSNKCRGDGSSSHSRELKRLFLAWLPSADSEFLEAAEGLGNSQKAEVAWLERKGYPYTERDVSPWLSKNESKIPVKELEPAPKLQGQQLMASVDVSLPGTLALAPDA